MAIETKRNLAVITGASSGIGFNLARECLEHDFDVVVCAENHHLDQAAASLAALGNVIAIRADLSTFEGCETLAQAVRELRRPIDALLLNAGVGVGGPFLHTELGAELSMVALNCNHTVHIAKAFVPSMVDRGQGRVLITGSVVSTAPAPFEAVYGATKAFVMSFGEALRRELEDTGVTVTVLQPGPTDTRFFERAELEDTRVGHAEKDDPALVAKQGFEAMMEGRDSVRAGSFRSRVEGLVNEILPEPTKASAEAKQAEPIPH